MASLSHSLITVMQRVNRLTTAIEDTIVVQEETGNVIIDLSKHPGVSEYVQISILVLSCASERGNRKKDGRPTYLIRKFTAWYFSILFKSRGRYGEYILVNFTSLLS